VPRIGGTPARLHRCPPSDNPWSMSLNRICAAMPTRDYNKSRIRPSQDKAVDRNPHRQHHSSCNSVVVLQAA
jgi:hypothetical protein